MKSPRWILNQLILMYGEPCLCCNEAESTTVDHIIPVARGGGDCLHNLQPLCGYCNSFKGVAIADYRPTTIIFSQHDRELEIGLLRLCDQMDIKLRDLILHGLQLILLTLEEESVA